MLWAPSSLADIEISERGKIVRLEVSGAPIAEVIGELAERFDFVVEGAPEHWSPEDIDFRASGELEDVLGSLLKDTSHVYAYHTNPDTGRAQIAAVKLLNRGKANPNSGFTASPARTAGSTANTPRTTRSLATGLRGPDGIEHRVEMGGTQSGAAANARAQTNRAGSGSSLSANLERRARMTAGLTGDAAGGNSSGSATATTQRNTVNLQGDAQADMQALTRRALQDVQNLAEALRQTEGSN